MAALLVNPSSVGVNGLRPADLWDAEVWTAASGPHPATSLHRGPLDDDGLTAFYRAHLGQREMVLAAVERYLTSGAPLAVVGTEVSAPAHWAFLVGRLLLPSAAWRLPFSTYERLDARPLGITEPSAIVGVPVLGRVAPRALAAQGYTVLADDEEPIRNGQDEWALRSGPAPIPGPWARLAETVIVADLLPEVTRRIERLAVEVGDSTADRPAWALAAAVLLLDDVDEFGDLGRDAAALVLDHWPAALQMGSKTAERLLERLRRHISPPSQVTELIFQRSHPSNVVAYVASLERLHAALTSPAVLDRHQHTLPELLAMTYPAARRELDKVLGGALEWVMAAADSARALLEITGLMDGAASPLDLRLRAVELARELLVPKLLESATDPARSGWPPIPAWLWDSVVPELATTPQLEHGIALPGENLSTAMHEWLGSLSLPAGELTAEALRRTGPVEWERAAYRLYVRRDQDITPLERAAAFLRTVHCAAVNEGTGMDRWVGRAIDEIYRRPPLDLPTALVLMDVLPPDLAFAATLAGVLQRTPPSVMTRAAVERLYSRETIPSTLERLFARHQHEEVPTAVRPVEG
ncbi:hypothetical protein ACI79J_07510 [Geodermatophilus sp. SYSU D01062]